MSGSKKNTIDAILLLSFFVEVTFVSASSSTTQLSLERSMQKQLTYPKYKANTFNDLSLSESARRFSIWRPNRSHIDFRTFAPTKSLAKWQLLNRSCRSWCPFMRHVGFSGKIGLAQQHRRVAVRVRARRHGQAVLELRLAPRFAGVGGVDDPFGSTNSA